MTIRINLKSGSYIEMENFSEISYTSPVSLVTKINEELKGLSINGGTAYYFNGKQQIVITRAEILYLVVW